MGKVKFQIKPVYDDKTMWYHLYQKTFWGWKYIGRFVYKTDAVKIAKELSEPPTIIEPKK